MPINLVSDAFGFDPHQGMTIRTDNVLQLSLEFEKAKRTLDHGKEQEVYLLFTQPLSEIPRDFHVIDIPIVDRKLVKGYYNWEVIANKI